MKRSYFLMYLSFFIAGVTTAGAERVITTYTTIPFFPGFLLACLAGFAAWIVFGIVVTMLGM
jgi:hypothetical protein